VLHGNEQVASLLLVVFSVGIGAGSLLCEVLSRRHVEIGLVPLGAIGMTVFSVDLYFASSGLPARPVPWAQPSFPGPSGALAGAGRPGAAVAVAGLYSVPMYALIQLRSQPTHRAAHHRGQQHPQRAVHDRQLADGGCLLKAGLTVTQTLSGHWGCSMPWWRLYIFLLVPEYLLRFVAWMPRA
jgi:hypothetical protein